MDGRQIDRKRVVRGDDRVPPSPWLGCFRQTLGWFFVALLVYVLAHIPSVSLIQNQKKKLDDIPLLDPMVFPNPRSDVERELIPDIPVRIECHLARRDGTG